MSEEVSVTIGLPQVIKTEAKRGGVEIRAYETIAINSVTAKSGGLSAHYAVDAAEDAPHIGEKLLVAVLSGVRPAWLDPESNIWATHDRGLEPLKVREPVDITFEAVSAMDHGGNDPSRAMQFDTLHLSGLAIGDDTRLRVAMRNESGSLTHADVVLSKGQVTSMLAALLAIYPRLCMRHRQK